jgi:threonine-phosphate decarboxylase
VNRLNHGGNVFAVARRRGWDWRSIADFSASINPLGPSPAVAPALQESFDRLVHYPETDALALRTALAGHWHTAPENLLVGNGATDLIHFFGRQWDGPVYLAAPVFSEFPRAFPGAVTVPFHARAWPRDGLVVVTRPANPTGALPDLADYDGPLLVDESFIEFTAAPSLLPQVQHRPHLYVLRSLTKFFAIPGLRAGALAGPAETIQAWQSQREPWTLNVLAEAAVQASLADPEHARRTVAFVEHERAWLRDHLAALPGVRPWPGTANFLLLELDGPAAPLVAALEDRRILARDCSGWAGVPPAHALRVAVRPRAENQRLLNALREVLCGLSRA